MGWEAHPLWAVGLRHRAATSQWTRGPQGGVAELNTLRAQPWLAWEREGGQLRGELDEASVGRTHQRKSGVLSPQLLLCWPVSPSRGSPRSQWP